MVSGRWVYSCSGILATFLRNTSGVRTSESPPATVHHLHTCDANRIYTYDDFPIISFLGDFISYPGLAPADSANNKDDNSRNFTATLIRFVLVPSTITIASMKKMYQKL